MPQVQILSPRPRSRIWYNAPVKLAAFATMVFVFAVTGCFNPKVQSGGFACSTTDEPPCPQGFFCVTGLCVDHPGSGGGGGGGGGGGDPAIADMTMSVAGDMSVLPHDMAQAPADMSMVSCGKSGDDCTLTKCCATYICFLGACF
jgi:hypothetical protein